MLRAVLWVRARGAPSPRACVPSRRWAVATLWCPALSRRRRCCCCCRCHWTQALGPATPVYLGEFGLVARAIMHEEEAAAWLRAVREAAEGSGMAWALWTYYTSPQGLVEGRRAAWSKRPGSLQRMRPPTAPAAHSRAQGGPRSGPLDPRKEPPSAPERRAALWTREEGSRCLHCMPR